MGNGNSRNFRIRHLGETELRRTYYHAILSRSNTFPHLWFRGHERFPKIDLDPAGIAPALQPGPLSGTRRHFGAITEADVDKTASDIHIGHSRSKCSFLQPRLPLGAFLLLAVKALWRKRYIGIQNDFGTEEG